MYKQQWQIFWVFRKAADRLMHLLAIAKVQWVTFCPSDKLSSHLWDIIDLLLLSSLLIDVVIIGIVCCDRVKVEERLHVTLARFVYQNCIDIKISSFSLEILTTPDLKLVRIYIFLCFVKGISNLLTLRQTTVKLHTKQWNVV